MILQLKIKRYIYTKSLFSNIYNFAQKYLRIQIPSTMDDLQVTFFTLNPTGQCLLKLAKGRERERESGDQVQQNLVMCLCVLLHSEHKNKRAILGQINGPSCPVFCLQYWQMSI